MEFVDERLTIPDCDTPSLSTACPTEASVNQGRISPAMVDLIWAHIRWMDGGEPDLLSGPDDGGEDPSAQMKPRAETTVARESAE
ncbi:unnamed protein product [Strongylus vulgaris]|uniref:Uncharacterized protein n=1 Tax=Strongylus vulgaris TaxID=40348 RepID=A0A3P7IV34_STRVU|nr:unnamed protein product [Strongylus vulgaris]